MRRDHAGRVDGPQDGRQHRLRARLLGTSAGLIAVACVAAAFAGSVDTDALSATEVRAEAPTTPPTVATTVPVTTEPEPAAPKGVAVVAPPTTTTTAPPPPTTEAPEPARESQPEPAPPADEPDPVTVVADPAPAPAPTPPPAPAPAPAGSVSANLDAIARCESGGNPDAYNPAGYYGAFQFSLATWWGLGMDGDPRDYTYAQQKYVAIALYNQRGYSPWPACARSLGLL